MRVYIKKVRDDDKIDLSLSPIGYAKVDSLSDKIMNELEARGGYMAIGDKTSPEKIYEVFGCSKKSYKMTIGTLFREGRIEILRDGIRKRG